MNLKALRAIKGVTQQEVCSYIGCSAVVYSRYETGEREPSLDMVVRLADYFGVTTDCLLGREAVAKMPLNDYEVSLLEAARCADQRARDDALNMLLVHSVSGKKESLA